MKRRVTPEIFNSRRVIWLTCSNAPYYISIFRKYRTEHPTNSYPTRTLSVSYVLRRRRARTCSGSAHRITISLVRASRIHGRRSPNFTFHIYTISERISKILKSARMGYWSYVLSIHRMDVWLSPHISILGRGVYTENLPRTDWRTDGKWCGLIRFPKPEKEKLRKVW